MRLNSAHTYYELFRISTLNNFLNAEHYDVEFDWMWNQKSVSDMQKLYDDVLE